MTFLYLVAGCQKELHWPNENQSFLIAKAGDDQTITLPLDSVLLQGSALTGRGTRVTTYQWTQLSGPQASLITNSTSASTRVSRLNAGIYHFVFSVNNSQNLNAKDTVQITVHPALSSNEMNYFNLQWNDFSGCAINIPNAIINQPNSNRRVYLSITDPAGIRGDWFEITETPGPFFYEVVGTTLRILSNTTDCNFDPTIYNIKVVNP